MLLNVAAHNVSIRNIKVSKRERHITYSVTKRTAAQNLQRHKTFSAHYVIVKKFCNGICYVTLSIMLRLRFENFTFWNSYVVCSYVL